jgi:alanine racemase
VLIGQQGSDRILAEELARRLATINYEITTGLSPRVPRAHGQTAAATWSSAWRRPPR